MGHFATSKDLHEDGEHLAKSRVALYKGVFGIISLIGTLGSFAYLRFASEGYAQGSYAYSWLFAFFFFLTIAMGGCFWVMLHHVSNSGWGVSVRRTMENVGYVFPFMAIFAVPFLFPEVQKYLWEWMVKHMAAGAKWYDFGHLFGNPEVGKGLGDQHETLLQGKNFYLNLPFWHVRLFLYFIGLTFAIWKLRNFSVKQDLDENPGTRRLFQARFHSAWAIPVFAVTLTFCAIDLVMALDYSWFSTMWGVYVFAGSALNAMAVILLVTILLRRAGYLKGVVTSEHDHIMGKLIFTFTVFWAYISFSQYFLYRYANVPEETRYFLLRNTEGWNLVSIVLVFGHFGIPFLMLLKQDLKKKHGFMIFLVVYLLVMHVLDIYHMVIPERGPSVSMLLEADHDPKYFTLGMAWIGDVIALVTIGSGCVYFLLRNLTSVALYPNRDPRILESANMHN